MVYLVPRFFVCFWLVILLFKMAPSHSAKVSFKCPKLTKADCPVGKIHVLVKLCSDMSYSAVGCEVNVNESTT